MSTKKYEIAFSLTAVQFEQLEDMAGEHVFKEKGPESNMWAKVWDALKEAQARVDSKELDEKARTRPCQYCERPVVHSGRGNDLAPAHKCPHGKNCITHSPGHVDCSTCYKELHEKRKAAAAR